MGMDYQMYRAWVNTSKGLRQCQKADKAAMNDKPDSATDHYGKALNYFLIAVDHLSKAEDDADVKAGKLLDTGNQELQKAVDCWSADDFMGANKHYDKALDKYDAALNLIN